MNIFFYCLISFPFISVRSHGNCKETMPSVWLSSLQAFSLPNLIWIRLVAAQRYDSWPLNLFLSSCGKFYASSDNLLMATQQKAQNAARNSQNPSKKLLGKGNRVRCRAHALFNPPQFKQCAWKLSCSVALHDFFVALANSFRLRCFVKCSRHPNPTPNPSKSLHSCCRPSLNHRIFAKINSGLQLISFTRKGEFDTFCCWWDKSTQAKIFNWNAQKFNTFD